MAWLSIREDIKTLA